MPPVLSICSGAALTVTVSGLTDEDAAHLQKLLVTSGLLFRPGFEFPKPGVVSIHGSIDQLRHCWGRLASHKPLPDRIRALFGTQLDNYLRTDYKVDIRSAKLDLGSRTHIMGILNVTPDSFSDGGRYSTVDRAVAHAADMKLSGADIIDVGGESTRPGAEPLSEDEELARIIPVIERVSRDSAVPLSVDTYKSSVAHRALKAGASMVNDISGLRFSPDMAKVAGDHGAAVVVMHIKGTPRDMQRDPFYGDVIGEITEYLAESIEIALKGGVRRDRIMIDPGIGFGKTLEHNLTILQRLDEFRILGCPIVLGTSRKRFIGTVLDLPEPQDRAAGTAATVALGVAKGAQVLRVHDVAQMAQVARMTDAIVRSGNPQIGIG